MDLERPDNSKQKIATGLAALVVIALLAGGASFYNSQQTGQQGATTNTPASSQTTTNSSTPTTSTPSTTSSSTPTTTSGYKDGTYSASSNYYVPHGSENIKVTLTVQGGTVTDSQIENSENDRESAQFQEEFTAEYKSQVVGKPLSSLQLNYVAGASDTTQGFNDALQQIKTDAKA